MRARRSHNNFRLERETLLVGRLEPGSGGRLASSGRGSRTDTRHIRFPFNGFNAKAVYDKLKHMEVLLDDPKLFLMPCSTPEHQHNIIISDCKLLATSEGKVTLGKSTEGAEGSCRRKATVRSSWVSEKRSELGTPFRGVYLPNIL